MWGLASYDLRHPRRVNQSTTFPLVLPCLAVPLPTLSLIEERMPAGTSEVRRDHRNSTQLF